jgi:hypothetical protein
MSTEKQTAANRKNAQLSTGAVTETGKAIVSRNAVRHGIFTKDLVINSGDGKEDAQEYQEILDNLEKSMNPSGQMEYLLMEKIAVDFWRMKRVIRFETGSIRTYLDMALYEFYGKANYDGSKDNKTNAELDKDISHQKECIEWNKKYIKCLRKGAVKFDKPQWSNDDLTSEIEDDLDLVIEKLKYDILDEETRRMFDNGQMSFEFKRKTLLDNEYDDKKLSEALADIFDEQNAECNKKIAEFEAEKIRVRCHAETNLHKLSLPESADSEKVMRYERSLQKSIMQNLLLLKRLQAERHAPPAPEEDWYEKTV